METTIIGAIRRAEHGATHSEILARVAPQTMLARRVFARAMRGLLQRGIVCVVECDHGDHDSRYVIPAWHDSVSNCCA